MSKFFKYQSLVFSLLFIVFAAVQYNDPDPLVWIYAYLVPAYISFSAFRNQFNKGLIAVVCIGALLAVVEFFPFGNFQGVALDQGMKTVEIELARESLGMVVVFVAMAIHWFQAGKRR